MTSPAATDTRRLRELVLHILDRRPGMTVADVGLVLAVCDLLALGWAGLGAARQTADLLVDVFAGLVQDQELVADGGGWIPTRRADLGWIDAAELEVVERGLAAVGTSK